MKNNKINIILIDDNIAFSDALKFCFDMYDDIHIKIYHDALDFLNEYNNAELGFILMDLFMPRMDGIALLQELKKRHNKMYTIVISGHADKATAAKVKELGADEFISKPFNIEELLKKIRSINSSELKKN